MARLFRTGLGGAGVTTQSSSLSLSHHRLNQNQRNNNNTNTLSTAAKIRHMKLTQTYRTYLDEELKTHTSHIESLLQTIYRRADVPLHGRMSLKIGAGFQNLLLGSDGDNIGAGGGVGAHGVENTVAAGMDLLLKVLLRILRGIAPSSSSPSRTKDQDETTTVLLLQESHRDLLFSLLLPLHKPSGMVLWRDQTPLLGLYHRSTVHRGRRRQSRRVRRQSGRNGRFGGVWLVDRWNWCEWWRRSCWVGLVWCVCR